MKRPEQRHEWAHLWAICWLTTWSLVVLAIAAMSR